MAPGYFPRHSLSVETGECSLSPTRARCASLTRRGPVNPTSGYLRNVHAGLFGEDGGTARSRESFSASETEKVPRKIPHSSSPLSSREQTRMISGIRKQRPGLPGKPRKGPPDAKSQPIYLSASIARHSADGLRSGAYSLD